MSLWAEQPQPTGIDAIDKMIERQNESKLTDNQRAWKHIHDHVEDSGGGRTLDPKMDFGSLESKAERMAFMNKWTQGSAGGATGAAQCGAASLLAGSVYSGGGTGVSTLIDAVEKMQKKTGPLDDATKKEFARLDELKAKIKDHGHLSAEELGRVQNDLFKVLSTDSKGQPNSSGGSSEEKVKELFKTAPELKKMFEKADVRYEKITPSGANTDGHAVLGIGHKKGTNTHEAVYDPWARVNVDPAAREETAHAREAAENAKHMPRSSKDKAVNEQLKREQEHLEQAAKEAQARQFDKEQAPQVVTDPQLLRDYSKATPSWLDDTQHDARNPKDSPFKGMY